MRPETSRRESPGPACPEILQSAGPAPRAPAGERPDRGLDRAAGLAGSRFLRVGRRAYLRSRAIVPCSFAARRAERSGHTAWGQLCEDAGLLNLAFREFQLALRDDPKDAVAALRLA